MKGRREAIIGDEKLLFLDNVFSFPVGTLSIPHDQAPITPEIEELSKLYDELPLPKVTPHFRVNSRLGTMWLSASLEDNKILRALFYAGLSSVLCNIQKAPIYSPLEEVEEDGATLPPQQPRRQRVSSSVMEDFLREAEEEGEEDE